MGQLHRVSNCISYVAEVGGALRAVSMGSRNLLRLGGGIRSVCGSDNFPGLGGSVVSALTGTRGLGDVALNIGLSSLLHPGDIKMVSLGSGRFASDNVLGEFVGFAGHSDRLRRNGSISKFLDFRPSGPSASRFKLKRFIINTRRSMGQAVGDSLANTSPVSSTLGGIIASVLHEAMGRVGSVLGECIGIGNCSFISLVPRVVFCVHFTRLYSGVGGGGLPLYGTRILPGRSEGYYLESVCGLGLNVGSTGNRGLSVIAGSVSFGSSEQVCVLANPGHKNGAAVARTIKLTFLLTRGKVCIPTARVGFDPYSDVFARFPTSRGSAISLNELNRRDGELTKVFSSTDHCDLLLLGRDLTAAGITRNLCVTHSIIGSVQCLNAETVFGARVRSLTHGLSRIGAAMGNSDGIRDLMANIRGKRHSFGIFVTPPRNMDCTGSVTRGCNMAFSGVGGRVSQRHITTPNSKE